MSIVSRRSRIWPVLAAVTITMAMIAACTGKPTPPASGDLAGTSLVIAVAEEPVTMNPLAGYAEHGAAKIFDGLVEHRANGSLRPTLTTELPEPAPDGKSWTAKLRAKVTFADGSPFDATDVVATYKAVLDPRYASPLRQRFPMLSGVQQVDSATVRFELSRPYAPFLELLVLGILPSEALATPAPVTNTPDPPVGTGPYRLTEWQHGQHAVLEANTSYFDGAPAIKKVTVEFRAADEDRAARLRAGKLDGAALPPALARTFENAAGLRVVAHTASDLHAILMPPSNPVTADPALRIALNYGINRKALVDGPLAGKGSEVSTPMPDVLTEFVEPTATYPYDVTRALDRLSAAGWSPGADGMRMKNGQPAAFTLLYPGGDTMARDLTAAFAAAARGIGVAVTPQAVDSSALLARSAKDAVLVDFGDPFDPDLRLYDLLHSGANPTIDTALEAGRTATDPAERATAYRKLQRTYLDAPSMIVLVAPEHTYVMRDNWNGYQPVVDADSTDFTWGAWWNLNKWTPR